MASLRGTLAALVTGIAAVLVIGALAVLPYLTPAWVGFGQSRAGAEALTAFTTDQLRTVTGQILEDLVIGPPDFDVTLDGVAVLKEAEREHMRDVRGVFVGFFSAAAMAGIVLVALFAAARHPDTRRRLWHRLELTGYAATVGTLGLGVAGLLLFDAAFRLFHEVFFPGGNWQFDPQTDRLVQLFPESFWVESTIAVGGTIAILGLLLAVAARRRGTVRP